MKELTPEEKDRAVQLLNDIVRPFYEIEDDRRLMAAIPAAQVLLGYREPVTATARRPRKTLKERLAHKTRR